VPPGNPLHYYDHPFRPQWTQRTREGRVCYFCRVPVDSESLVPCCLAAEEWATAARRRAVRAIWDVVARQVRE
jgi:hypothetical protein